jgi:hypothetical protein
VIDFSADQVLYVLRHLNALRLTELMSRKSTHRDYYVVVTRDAGSMRFGRQIKRRATPMGVKLEDHNLASYDAAKAAGKRALAELLDGISSEELLADHRKR